MRRRPDEAAPAQPRFATSTRTPSRRRATSSARKKVAIFIVAFQAERFITSVLDRIPPPLRDLFAEILVIDDSSSDETFATARDAGERLGFSNVTVLRTPFNRGYGGNQKLGYLHAVKQGYDYVILLHGDGQYAPEYLPQIVNALGEHEPGALIASRMINRRGRAPRRHAAVQVGRQPGADDDREPACSAAISPSSTRATAPTRSTRSARFRSSSTRTTSTSTPKS